MKRSSHTKKKTTGDGDPDDPNDPSGEESGYDDDDRMSDKLRRPDIVEEAEETDRSVREITPLMKEWEKVTGSKQRPNGKKSKQLATARELAKIRDSETCDGKSQKCRDQITFDQGVEEVLNSCYGKHMIFKVKKHWKEPVSVMNYHACVLFLCSYLWNYFHIDTIKRRYCHSPS